MSPHSSKTCVRGRGRALLDFKAALQGRRKDMEGGAAEKLKMYAIACRLTR